MTILGNIDHEEGDFSDWTGTSGVSAELDVTEAAALAGTSYGLQAHIDDDDIMFCYKSFTLATNEVRLRFYFDPNGLSFSSGDHATIGRLACDGSYMGYGIFADVQFRNNAGTWEWRPVCNDDENDYNHVGTYLALTDDEHCFEMHIVRETGDGNDDGYCDWWVDDVQQARVSSIDNYNLFPTVKWWDSGVIYWWTYTATSGTIYFDEIIVRDTGNAIGCDLWCVTTVTVTVVGME